MKIKTLEHIHRLLQAEEARTGETYKNARSLQNQYEESENQDPALIKSQKEAADLFMKIHFAAVEALNDFENQEW